MTRTYWLSFCDEDKPQGHQFLGACVVDVTEADAEAAKRVLAVRFPHAQEGAEWIAAASRKAHMLGCNPGGQMMSIDITDAPEAAMYPRGRLLNREALEAIAPVVSAGELEAEDQEA